MPEREIPKSAGRTCMPERFAFACFLDRPKIESPRQAIDAARVAFSGKLGPPVEAMLLDLEHGIECAEPWSAGHPMLDSMPSGTNLLFVYFTDAGGGRCNIGMAMFPNAITVTASLESMAIQERPEEVADLCLGLLAAFSDLAAECVVAAGGELEFSEQATNASEAIHEACAPLSLARWIAHDIGRQIVVPRRFVEVRRSASGILLRAN